MDLFEFQTKEQFRQAGLVVPDGDVATTPEETAELAAEFGPEVAVKAQVLVGGRMKAGGIRIVSSPEEAGRAAQEILGMDIKGHRVRKVLVESASVIAQEIYLAAMVDRTAQRLMLMASAAGGIDIEEVAATSPENIRKAHLHPLLGFRPYQGLQLAKELGLPVTLWSGFAQVCQKLFEVLTHNDADLAEINPLILNSQGEFIALDGKMSIDDNALPRQSRLISPENEEEGNDLERKAKAVGLNFIHLGGNVACMGNGAGLAMATMDAIKYFGGNPANFLDIGGGATIKQVTQALEIMTGDPTVRSLLVNVSGGITRCDDVATGIAAALQKDHIEVPFVIRLVGTNEEEAREILAPYNVTLVRTFTEAAQSAVKLARGNA